MKLLRPALALLLFAVSSAGFAACIETAGGIGGTGISQAGVANAGGIGGTGVQASGGIGGTGIVGTITGFASVCINGLEVQYDDTTRVRRNGATANLQQLAIGQVIAIEATEAAHGLWARKIDVLNAVEGRVSRVAAQQLDIMGQKIRLNDGTLFAGVDSAQAIKVGMPLKVSGYRNAAQEIIASRIERAEDLASSSIVGIVVQDDAGHDAVSGTAISAPALANGTEVLVRGEWDGQQLHVASVQANPSLAFTGHVQQIVLEGLVMGDGDGKPFKVNGLEISPASMAAMRSGKTELTQGCLVRITGQMQPDQRLQIQHIDLMQRPDTVRHLPSAVPAVQGKNPQGGMVQPSQTGRGNMSYADPLFRPATLMRSNRPMPMMKR